MAEIEAYDIPEEIKDIEFNGNIPLSHENLALEPKTIEEYIFKYTSLVYLEEAASLKRLVDFDLEKVKLRLRSRKDQTFQIVDDLESVCSSVHQKPLLFGYSLFIFLKT